MSAQRTAPAVAILIALATSGCGLVPKRVARDDCEAWADRVLELAKAAQDEADRKCPTKRTSEEREDERRATSDLRDEVLRTCGEHVGQSYAPRDAQCLEGARNMAGLRACAFATPMFHELSSWVLAAEQVVELRCKARTKPSDEPGDKTDEDPKKKTDEDPKKKTDEDPKKKTDEDPKKKTEKKKKEG